VAAGSHASNAPFTIKHSTGSATVLVNQRLNGGQWMLLGTYTFSAGTAGTVTLTDKANGTVIADAVKLVPTGGGTTQEALRYLHTDHLGTPRLATDAAQQVLWRWDGNAFGDSAPNQDPDGDGTLTTVNLRYPGQYFDGETGLHYNWNRYYDPKTGRYITSDPIGLAGGLNTYSYVYNNPLSFIDPLGLKVYLTSHNISPTSSWHTTLLLIPDDQHAFAGRPGFLKGGASDGLANGKWYTVISAEPDSSNPFNPGNLIGERNRSSDLPGENTVNREVTASGPLTYSNTCRAKPPGDTELINYLINFAASYGNNAPYGYPRRFSNTGELPPDTYNSNSYTAGILRAINASTAAPSDNSFPGFDRPLPLNFFSSPKY
jgi:RHS repeat-associated protein